MPDLKIGDPVTWCSGHGQESYGPIIRIEGDRATVYDVGFCFEVDAKLSKLCCMTRTLDLEQTNIKGQSGTNRELIDAYLKEMKE